MSDTPTPSTPAASGGGPEVTRRGLIAAGWGAFVLFLGGAAAGTARFMLPNVLYEPSQRFKMGKAKDFPLGVTIMK